MARGDAGGARAGRRTAGVRGGGVWGEEGARGGGDACHGGGGVQQRGRVGGADGQCADAAAAQAQLGDREEREEISSQILDQTGATCIQSVGGMVLIMRPAAKPKPHLSNLVRHG